MRLHPFRAFAAMLAGAALLGFAPRAGAVTINITYTDAAGEGFLDPALGAQRRACIEAAAANWANRLQGTVPIEVSASMDPMEGDANWAVLGGASAATFLGNYANAPVQNVFYAVGLANQFAGSDLKPTLPDINITYNSEVDGDVVLGPSKFYYGTDGRVTLTPGGDGYSYYNIDFYQTCLHEIGHGLGITSFALTSGAWNGGYPTIYDYYLATGDTATATRLRSLSQTSRAQKVISNALFFAGTNARAAAGGVSPKIYAPSPYEPGSSVSHLDENTYSAPWVSGNMPNSLLNELMTPMLGPGVMHHNGPMVTGILMDMGWKFKPYTFAEVGNGLKIAAGLRTGSEGEIVRLQRGELTKYPGRLSMADIMAAARGAAGTDANPYFLTTP